MQNKLRRLGALKKHDDETNPIPYDERDDTCSVARNDTGGPAASS